MEEVYNVLTKENNISFFSVPPYLFILLAGPPQHPPQLGDFEAQQVNIIIIWVGVGFPQQPEVVVVPGNVVFVVAAVLDVCDVGDDSLAVLL